MERVIELTCEGCGHNEAEMDGFRTICLGCGASLNHETGEVLNG